MFYTSRRLLPVDLAQNLWMDYQLGQVFSDPIITTIWLSRQRIPSRLQKILPGLLPRRVSRSRAGIPIARAEQFA